MTVGQMRDIRYFDEGGVEQQPSIRQYVFIHEDEVPAFNAHVQQMSMYDVFTPPIEKGGSFEPTDKTFVVELDRWVVLYERIFDESHSH